MIPNVYPTFEYKIATKDEVISIFDENYELFLSIVEFANNTDGNFYILYNPWNGDRIVENRGNEQEIETMSNQVKSSIKELSKKLKYFCVFEFTKEEIYFVIKYGEIEKGICFLGNNQKPSYPDTIEPIKDNWNYYTIEH